MSIPVDVADLPAALADVEAAYLLSTGGDGRVKAVSVRVSQEGDRLRVATPGRGSLANVGANPAVTLLYPPVQPAPPEATAPGFSLLVDGDAEVDGDDVLVRPTSAVWHKPAR